jgi:hypothetical protein
VADLANAGPALRAADGPALPILDEGVPFIAVVSACREPGFDLCLTANTGGAFVISFIGINDDPMHFCCLEEAHSPPSHVSGDALCVTIIDGARYGRA